MTDDPRASAIAYLQGELSRVAGRSPDRLPLLLRSVRACLEAVDGLPREALLQALSQRSDIEAALFTLSAASSNPADVVTRDQARALQARRALTDAEGGLFTAVELAGTLSITRQGVDWKRKNGLLLSVHHPGRRAWMYPCWQVGPGGLLKGIPEVLCLLRQSGHDEWGALRFFLSPHPTLGDRPLDRLRSGDLGAVLAAASVPAG